MIKIMKKLKKITQEIEQLCSEEELRNTRHFNSIELQRYINKLNTINNIKDNSKILDFGCGFGFITAYVSSFGYDVTGVDVLEHNKLWDFLSKKYNSNYLHVNTILPFKDNKFDIIIAFGSLEHTDDINQSLQELYRVLKKGGKLYIYNLPNKYSITELITKAHENKYNIYEVVNILLNNGFVTDKWFRSNLLPAQIFTGSVRKFLDKHYEKYNRIDDIFAQIPLSQSINIIVVKVND